MRKSKIIVVNSNEQVFLDKQGDLNDRIQTKIIVEEEIAELSELLNGKIKGRTRPDQSTLFINNTGMGIQFVATAYRIFQQAKAKGIDKNLDPELFITRRGD